MVQTIGGEGGGGTKVAGAVDGVAPGAAACAAITGAYRTGGGRGDRSGRRSSGERIGR